MAQKREALNGDPTLIALLQDLGAVYGTLSSSDQIRHAFHSYLAPAGQGKRMVAGPGRAVPVGEGTGHWQIHDVTNGLVGAIVTSVLQDREGHPWVATQNNGVCRYDGQGWTTLTTEDGLAPDLIASLHLPSASPGGSRSTEAVALSAGILDDGQIHITLDGVSVSLFSHSFLSGSSDHPHVTVLVAVSICGLSAAIPVELPLQLIYLSIAGRPYAMVHTGDVTS